MADQIEIEPARLPDDERERCGCNAAPPGHRAVRCGWRAAGPARNSARLRCHGCRAFCDQAFALVFAPTAEEWQRLLGGGTRPNPSPHLLRRDGQ